MGKMTDQLESGLSRSTGGSNYTWSRPLLKLDDELKYVFPMGYNNAPSTISGNETAWVKSVGQLPFTFGNGFLVSLMACCPAWGLQ